MGGNSSTIQQAVVKNIETNLGAVATIENKLNCVIENVEVTSIGCNVDVKNACYSSSVIDSTAPASLEWPQEAEVRIADCNTYPESWRRSARPNLARDREAAFPVNHSGLPCEFDSCLFHGVILPRSHYLFPCLFLHL